MMEGEPDGRRDNGRAGGRPQTAFVPAATVTFLVLFRQTSGRTQAAIALGLVALVLLVLVLSWRRFRSEIASDYRSGQGWSRKLDSTIALAIGCAPLLFFCYVGVLGLGGQENPLDAATASWPGRILSWWVLFSISVVFLAFAAAGVRWLLADRRDLPAYLQMAMHRLCIFAAAPILFPIRDWRLRTREGAGAVTKLASSAYAALLGLAVVFFLLMVLGIVSVLVAAAIGWVG